MGEQEQLVRELLEGLKLARDLPFGDVNAQQGQELRMAWRTIDALIEKAEAALNTGR